MRLLLHAIATPEPLDHGPSGPVHGAPVARIDAAAVTAWVSSFANENPSFGREALLAEHDLLTALHQALEGCLPARFPTWIDEEGLRAELDLRSTELTAALEHVRRRSELAVVALWTEADERPPATLGGPPGTGYLRQRQHAFAGSDRRRAQARALAQDLECTLGESLLDRQHTICPSAEVALSSSFLVPRDRAEALRGMLAQPRENVRILVNGPWPPYTFANVVRGRHERRTRGAEG
jgi:hypothetical protein